MNGFVMRLNSSSISFENPGINPFSIMVLKAISSKVIFFISIFPKEMVLLEGGHLFLVLGKNWKSLSKHLFLEFDLPQSALQFSPPLGLFGSQDVGSFLGRLTL